VQLGLQVLPTESQQRPLRFGGSGGSAPEPPARALPAFSGLWWWVVSTAAWRPSSWSPPRSRLWRAWSWWWGARDHGGGAGIGGHGGGH